MLSVIVVSYNTSGLLRQCLRSLGEHCPNAEVIVVDNNSQDGSADMVRADFPNVILVALKENVGFARGNNVGLPFATGEYVLLLNSDTYLEDDSLDRCMQWMEAHPQVAATSPRLIGFDGIPQRAAHPYPSFRRKLRETLRLSPGPSEERVEEGQGWLIGAALMLRRDAILPLREFLDTSYFMYWEDTDICSRLAEAGWKLAIFRDGHVRHLGGASSNGKQGGQRPALHACFVRGKYKWYARYRPRWERIGIWGLDALEVARKFGRGVAYRRRSECVQANTLASVLLGMLWARGGNNARAT